MSGDWLKWKFQRIEKKAADSDDKNQASGYEKEFKGLKEDCIKSMELLEVLRKATNMINKIKSHLLD